MTDLNKSKEALGANSPTDADRLRDSTEEKLLRAYTSSLLSTSPTIDKFSTWLLVGIGATATLIITNIESISKIVSFEHIRTSLLLLIISGLLGFLEKYLALDTQVNLSQEETLRAILASLSSDYEFRKRVVERKEKLDGKKTSINIDIPKVLTQYAGLHPWPVRRRLNRNHPLPIILRKRISCYYRQLSYAILELLAFCAFVFIIALSI